jgi:MFS family permease
MDMTSGLLMIGSIISMYIAGRVAERRGRSFRSWAWIAALIGPLALPLLFLFPNLHGKNSYQA